MKIVKKLLFYENFEKIGFLGKNLKKKFFLKILKKKFFGRNFVFWAKILAFGESLAIRKFAKYRLASSDCFLLLRNKFCRTQKHKESWRNIISIDIKVQSNLLECFSIGIYCYIYCLWQKCPSCPSRHARDIWPSGTKFSILFY